MEQSPPTVEEHSFNVTYHEQCAGELLVHLAQRNALVRQHVENLEREAGLCHACGRRHIRDHGGRERVTKTSV